MQTQSSNTRFVVKLIGLSVLLSAVAFSRNAFALTKLECETLIGKVVTNCKTYPEGYTVCKDYCRTSDGKEYPISALLTPMLPPTTRPADPVKAKPGIAPVDSETPGISTNPTPHPRPPTTPSASSGGRRAAADRTPVDRRKPD
jgi:hypothetical protein